MERRTLLATGFGAGLAAPALLSLAQAQTPAPAQAPAPSQAPGYYRFRVGQSLLTMVHDGQAIRPDPTQTSLPARSPVLDALDRTLAVAKSETAKRET